MTSILGKLLNGLRCAVSREGVYFERDLHLVEKGSLSITGRSSAAHYYANDRIHLLTVNKGFVCFAERRSSRSASSSMVTFTIHPSPYGSLFTNSGWSSSFDSPQALRRLQALKGLKRSLQLQCQKRLPFQPFSFSGDVDKDNFSEFALRKI